jgi:hypothetical protein
MAHTEYTKSEWTVSFKTGGRVETRCALDRAEKYGKAWEEQFANGERDDWDDPDSDWRANIDVTDTDELRALLALLDSLGSSIVGVDIHARCKVEALGVETVSTLLSTYYKKEEPVARVEVEDRDATKDARIKRAAESAVATLQKSLKDDTEK